MKIGPKFKIARRLGAPIFEKTQGEKYQLSLSRKEGKRSFGPRSEYARQHNEKQKVRFTYGITEGQLHNYVRKAAAASSNKTEALYSLLESRLDNVVYRMGLAPTRRAGRQMVAHGHIVLSGRKVKTPSQSVSTGDKVSIRAGSRGAGVFGNLTEKLKDHSAPSWISFSPETAEGEIKERPKLDNLGLDLDFASVLEFYSR